MSNLAEPISEKKSQNIEAIYPLSPLQEGLLFHALLDPDSPVYFEQVSCRLSSLKYPRLFQRAWQLAVERHASLRTSFYWKNRKQPLQIVRKQCTLKWTEEDWRDTDQFDATARLDAFLRSDRSRGFDLSKAPLMRCAMFQLGEADYQFVWSHHHLILDGWSASLVIDDVLNTYEALSTGDALRVSNSPAAFREYINWLAKRDSSVDEDFWRTNLKGISMPTSIEMPKTALVSSDVEAKYHEQELHLTPQLTDKLQQLARQRRLTLSCIVQGAWAFLLSRMSGDSDVMFGSTVSGRPPELDDVESMVGVFINALPVRVQVQSDALLLPWLQQLMADQVEREQHAHNPLVNIHAWSEIHSGQPLFESLVIFENYPLRGSEGRIKVDDLRLFRQTNYPLTLEAAPGASLKLAVSYESSRFDDEVIAQTLQRLQLVLEQFAFHPEKRLGELTILTPEEHAWIKQRNETATPFPIDDGFHKLFEDWAQRTPDAVALALDGQHVTYGELNARSNQMARHLQAYGVGPETLVAVLVERSIDMLVAILGILKAGAAYLPLDPAYPADRLAYMMEDSGVPVVVAQENLEERIPSVWAQIIFIDSAWPEIAMHSNENLAVTISPDNLAYVIYTSGSTGHPKGVQVCHRGLCNLAHAQHLQLSSGPGSHVLQFASLSFDASAWEIAMALGSGATLHLGTAEDLLPGQSLARVLNREAITHVTLPPSALEILPESSLPELKTLIVAGEACPPDLIAQWQSNRRFVNAYGPTESTVCATMWDCQNELTSPPLGSPLPNTYTYIFDPQLNSTPPGYLGELYLGGVNLARGYLRRPGLTAQRFVPDRMSGVPGARLYRTGDLVRCRPDGEIVFTGRSDHQVKIRGHRVEVGEVEAVLSGINGVMQAVVIAVADAAGGHCLSAYFVADQSCRQTKEVEPATLRRRLQERLPEYMIPSSFVQIESIPLTPNGKVDRKALSLLSSGMSPATREFRAPRDIFEQKLARIWEEVLGVRPVGVEDDFFLLGGHSLLAVRLMAWIEQEFGQQLPLAILFNSPTIAQLATTLRDKVKEPEWSALVAIQPAGQQPPLFVVPGGGGNVVYLYALARQLGHERPIYGLQALGLDGGSAPHDSIEEMAKAYVDAIQQLQPVGPYHLAGHSSGGWVAFEMARQLRTMGQEVGMVAVVDTPAPISQVKTHDVDSDEALYLFKVARLIERWADKPLGISYEDLQSLSVSEQMVYLGERLKGVDILPPEANRSQVLGLVQVFKASTRNCMRYRPQRKYDGNLTLLRAKEIHVEDTGIQINLVANDETWGWNQLVEGRVDVRIVPGDHITMMAEPYVRTLACELSTAIGAREGETLQMQSGGVAAS